MGKKRESGRGKEKKGEREGWGDTERKEEWEREWKEEGTIIMSN